MTKKQKIFADEYLIDLNATRAYRVAYPSVKKDETAAAAAARMLRNVKVGEYANPSFESQVETVAKAKQGGIMSIERCVEELYGDSLDEHCKEEEIARLKAEQGIQDVEEPAVNMDAGDFHVDMTGGDQDESKSGAQNVPDEQKEVPAAPGSSQAAGSSDRGIRNREK